MKIVFDLDGTLLILPIDWMKIIRKLNPIVGGITYSVFERLREVSKKRPEVRDKVNKIMEEIEMESLNKVQKEDCLEDLLESISEHEIYLVTMQSSRYARAILEKFGITKYFNGIYGREVTKNYLREEQLRYIGVERGDILVGDIKQDIIAAKKFGMIPIGVGRNKLRRVLLKNYGAHFVVKDLCELKEILVREVFSPSKNTLASN